MRIQRVTAHALLTPMQRRREMLREFVRIGPPAVVLLGLILAMFGGGSARAVPAFAAQTGQPCQMCHVGGFGPQLTPYGRNFKLGGYTLRKTPFNVPLSAMGVASYVHTHAPQDEPPA